MWHTVDLENYLAKAYDFAGYNGELNRMMPDGTETSNTAYGWLNGGTLTWKIPFGWKSASDTASNAPPVGVFAEGTRQIMSITANGDFSVQKLGHEAIRFIDGTVMLDGDEVGTIPGD